MSPTCPQHKPSTYTMLSQLARLLTIIPFEIWIDALTANILTHDLWTWPSYSVNVRSRSTIMQIIKVIGQLIYALWTIVQSLFGQSWYFHRLDIWPMTFELWPWPKYSVKVRSRSIIMEIIKVIGQLIYAPWIIVQSLFVQSYFLSQTDRQTESDAYEPPVH